MSFNMAESAEGRQVAAEAVKDTLEELGASHGAFGKKTRDWGIKGCVEDPRSIKWVV